MRTLDLVSNEQAKRAAAAKRAAEREELTAYVMADNGIRAILESRREKESVNAHLKRVTSYKVAAYSFDTIVNGLADTYGQTIEYVKNAVIKTYRRVGLDEQGNMKPYDGSDPDKISRVAGWPYIIEDTDITNAKAVQTAYNLRMEYLKARAAESHIIAVNKVRDYIKALNDPELNELIAKAQETGVITL